MSADDVITIRKEWDKYNYAPYLPEATVLASRDWLTYVRVMATMLPRDLTTVDYPSEEEARWSWPEGVAIVFEEPVVIEHTIISKDKQDVGMFGVTHQEVTDIPPVIESQDCQGMVFGIGQMMQARIAGTQNLVEETIYAIPVLYIGVAPDDIVSGTWIPGGTSLIFTEAKRVSEATCFLLAAIHALGHRLTREREVPTSGRGERRRVARELPSLRYIDLGTGASSSLSRNVEHGPQRVAYSHRWIVRGHWHTVVHGHHRQGRRLQWFDPYIKGPEDKPLDERRTVWKA